jgi:protein phosphatase
MKITLPELSLVVLVGSSGSGKSTFARKHFLSTEILSSDHFRAMVCDDESDQSVSAAAFELLHLTCAKRLALGKLTVVDATNVQPDARKPYLELARRFHVIPVAIVFDLPEKLCLERNQVRADRRVPAHVVRNHVQQLRRTLSRLRDEGFKAVHVVTDVEEITSLAVEREPLWVNKKSERGPFDIIGDIHGCFDELKMLLQTLGYTFTEEAVTPPTGRKAIFVGDLCDRGPNTPGVIELVMKMVRAGTALCVRGNHDDKLCRKLKGREVSITHGLETSLEQLAARTEEFRNDVRDFLDKLVSHYVLNEGKLVVAHAGMKEHLQGRTSERVRVFGLYGETTGESDEFGMPVRLNWAADYRGRAEVVYGHTAILQPEWLNRTLCIDTGCVYGGKLTALRYPEQEIVSVPALKMYCEPKRPLAPPIPAPAALSQQQVADDVLDMADVLGKRIISTPLISNITIREGNSAAALEVMSRFAVNPRWLIYLPPTMAPCETSSEPEYLEHPREAFSYFARENVAQVICEKKHMGSRAIVVVCRDEDAARKRFGVVGEGIGVCVTRTGRRFFEDNKVEAEFLKLVGQSIDGAGFWEKFQTDWFCLDGELMPWSAKAQDLLRNQYASTGSAGRSALAEVAATFDSVDSSGEIAALRQRFQDRARDVSNFVAAYRRYCWPVQSVSDLRYAPFHLLASAGKVHIDQDHSWHMQTLSYITKGGDLLVATPFQRVDINDAAQVEAAIRWWQELTESGGEGMVVKPLTWLNRGRRSWVQPAMKVRGREYLRIIYGPEYLQPENLARLRGRSLGLKQSLALREFALGIEAIERFVRGEPLRKIHECVFGVLALESEPVDPRL